MTTPVEQRAARDDDAPTSGVPGPEVARLSRAGVFANGVTAATVVQFILDYDETARIEDVAAHFHLEIEDVAAALRYYALNGERMHSSRQVVPPR